MQAGRALATDFALQSLSYGLIAPAPLFYYFIPSRNTVVFKGTLDTKQNATPEHSYAAAGPPKTLVTIPGANHFGYTDLCPPDNHAFDVGLYDNNGTIPRDAQQLAGAAYLAALVRYYALGDGTARDYLSGERKIDELDAAGAPGIEVESQGFA